MVCKKCLLEKDVEDFYSEKRNKSGLMGMCKECFNFSQKKHREKNETKVNLRSKLYYENNSEKIKEIHKNYRLENREKILIKQKIYRNENRESINKQMKLWKINNKEKVLVSQKSYREKNKENLREYRRKYRVENILNITINRKKTQPLINSYLKKKRDSDPLYRLTINVRNRLKSYLTIKNITKKNRTFNLVGCNPQELMKHLESHFQDNMSWDNYGLYGWHIDHIIPLSSAKTEEEIYKLCHYTNLQPLWAEDNLKKSNKLIN